MKKNNKIIKLNSNKEIIFFIDYNEKSGMGHLNRCLHFRENFKNQKITFVTEKKFYFKGIRNINCKLNDFKFKKKKYDVGIIDSYLINQNTEKKIKKACIKTIVIDDLKNRKYNCDYVINYDPYINKKSYEKKVSKKTILLLGYKYNFIKNNNINKNFNIKKKKLNVLIYFGTKNRSIFIQNKILKKIHIFKTKFNKIIILSNYKFKYKSLNIKFSTFSNFKKIEKLFKICDIYFLSTGIIIYEAINYNKLIFSKYISSNQKNNFEFLKKKKLIFPIKNFENYFKNSKLKINAEEKKNNFDCTFNNKPIFNLIINPITDKNGNEIHLEHFNFSDQNYFREIFNLQKKEYRKYYINPNIFNYRSHLNYLKKLDNSSNQDLFIIKNKKKFVGYIKNNIVRNKTEVSISINKNFQNRGISTGILKYLINENFFLKKPIAKINKKNLFSIKAFKNAGFKEIKLF